ncbi:MAG: ribose-phosphate diphosphokinase [Patescibacteria group bacterium]
METKKVVYYCGRGNHRLSSRILKNYGEYLGKECFFSHIDFEEFPDEEPDVKLPKWSEIKGSTVVFFQSIYKKEYLEELMELVWAMKKQYGAKHVIVVLLFMRFRRQDHEEKMEEICRLKMVIDRLKHDGVDEIITVSPHSPKMREFCTEVGIKMHEVDPSPLFASTVKTYLADKPTIYAPDAGSVPRAVKLAKLLDCQVVMSLKERGLDNEAMIKAEDRDEIEIILRKLRLQYEYRDIYYADSDHVKGQSIVMTEDEVTTGSTANKTGQRIKKIGAKYLILLAMHAVLVRSWRRKLFDKRPFDKVIMGDTIPRDYEKMTGGLIHDISVAELMAQALYKVVHQIPEKTK